MDKATKTITRAINSMFGFAILRTADAVRLQLELDRLTEVAVAAEALLELSPGEDLFADRAKAKRRLRGALDAASFLGDDL